MKQLFVLLIVLYFLSGCSLQRPKVFFNLSEKPTQHSSLAIAMNEDPANVRMDLQTNLLQAGYSIASTAGNENAENIMTFSYNYYFDDKGNVWLNSFWAEITRRESGTVLMSISYPPGNFKKNLVLKNFLTRMDLCIKENICDEKSQSKKIKPLDRIVGAN